MLFMASSYGIYVCYGRSLMSVMDLLMSVMGSCYVDQMGVVGMSGELLLAARRSTYPSSLT